MTMKKVLKYIYIIDFKKNRKILIAWKRLKLKDINVDQDDKNESQKEIRNSK